MFYLHRQWRIMMDTELLLLRGTVGPLMVGHGAGKLFGAFNAGYGIEGTAGFLESIGFRPGKPWAYLHGAAELGAGAGITAGLLTPFASAALIGVMATAARTAHAGKGPWASNGGWEFPLTLGAVGATLALTGPGKYSLDRVLGLKLSGRRWGLGAIALGLASSAAALAIRRKPAPESTAVDSDSTP
jgi:putative oxidoreductase